MKVLAIVASARKGKSTDTLVDKAIEGVKSANNDTIEVTKINLHDYTLKYCTDCQACRFSKSDKPYVNCILNDDMSKLNKLIYESDNIIIGTPLHMGNVPAILMTFLEKICWTFGLPGKNYLTVKGCPMPRSKKKRNIMIVITNALVSPIYRMFCDSATLTIKQTLHDSLNAKLIGDLYAGNIESRGVNYYTQKSLNLGKKLCF